MKNKEAEEGITLEEVDSVDVGDYYDEMIKLRKKKTNRVLSQISKAYQILKTKR